MNVAGRNLAKALSPEAELDVQRIEALWRDCRSRYGDRGPWLFGDFSIADAMYAPVALRFNTYGAALTDSSANYLKTVLIDRHVRAWIAAANPAF
jgi:glutathione S-transferase